MKNLPKHTGTGRFPHSLRPAFTLVELLVVITIILVLMAVTITSFNFSVNADRIRSGARQLQSFLAGARDKAIYAQEIRGVRLLLDPNNNHTVSAVQYVGSPQREIGSLTFSDTTGFNVTQGSTGVSWASLYRRGLLRVGGLIQIPSYTGAWYTISGINTNNYSNYNVTNNNSLPLILSLNRANQDLSWTSANSTQYGYLLLLAPAALGDAQPVPFPRNVVIDLDGSQVPPSWRPTSLTNPYPPVMDILFTPRGTVVGDALSVGMMHLHFADVSDVVKWQSNANLNGRIAAVYNTATYSLPVVPADNATVPAVVTKDRILATLSTRTGSVSVHYVNPTNGNNDSIADDPFSFAETGQVANK